MQALAFALAAALLVTAGVTAWTMTRLGATERDARGAPDLVVSGTGVAARTSVAGLAGVERTAPPLASADGGVHATGHDVSADLVDVGRTFPSWVVLTHGAASAAVATVVLEQGAAHALGVGVGDSVRLSTGGTGGRAARTESVVVTGLAADMSRATYPVDEQAVAFVTAATGARLALPDGDGWQLGVWTGRGARDAVQARIQDGLPGTVDLSASAVGAVGGRLDLLLALVLTALTGFGLATLGCAAMFLAGAARADQDRWSVAVGRLRAFGAEPAAIRRAMLSAQLRPVVGGAAVGALAGTMVAQAMIGGLAPTFGLPARPLGRVGIASLVVLLVFGAGGVLLSRSSRGVGRTPVSVQLAGPWRGARGHRRTRVRSSSGPLVLARAMVWSRTGAALTAVLLVATGLAATGFAVVMGSTLDGVQHSPRLWGIGYDWSVTVPDGASAAQVSAEQHRIATLPALGAQSSELSGRVGIRGGGIVPVDLVAGDRSLLPLSVLSGRAPRGAGEVAVGSGLAADDGLHPGSTLVLQGRAQIGVRVVGVVRDLQGSGQTVRGSAAIATALFGTTVPDRLLLAAAPGTDATRLRAEVLAVTRDAAVLTPGLDASRIPFEGAFQGVLVALGLGLALLGTVIAARTAVAATAAHAGARAVAAALGVGPRERRLVTAHAALRLAVLPGVAGFGLGCLAAVLAVRSFSAEVGGVPITVAPWLLVATLGVGVALPTLGVVLPVVGEQRMSLGARLAAT